MPWYYDTPLPLASQIAPRIPSYDNNREGKSWNVEEDATKLFTNFTRDGIDRHARNRARTLLSVDDYVKQIFDALDDAGFKENTFIMISSDHGSHLGSFGLPFEKSTMYETDVRIPFYVRGPGVPKNASALGLISLIDIGPTFIDLAGLAPLENNKRISDGRSFKSLLHDAGAPPVDWRDGVLIEHLGEVNQWMVR